MKKNIVCIFLFFLTFSSLFAQTETDSSFSLQQCIDYALTNEANVKNAELDQKIWESEIRKTKAIGYPKITLDASVVDNLQLQRMFLSKDNQFVNNAGGTRPEGAKESGDIVVVPNFFQLRSAGDASAQLSQLIFDGSYIVALKAAKSFRDLARQGVTSARIQTIETVTKDYYAVLIAEESSRLFDVNLQRLDTSIHQLKISYENGLVEDIDVKRLEVQYNNLLTDKQNSENLLTLSKLKLKLDMGMPLDQHIALTDSISVLEISHTPIPVEQFDVNKRIEYSLFKTQERLDLLDLKRYKFSRLPTLSAFAKGGAIRQDVQFINLFQNEWFSYGMVGLNLSVPILDFAKHSQIKQSIYKTKKNQNTLAQMENSLKLEASSARLNFNNSIQKMQNQKRNMDLAQEVSRVSNIKYREGVGSNIEVINAEADLQAAQINYYAALYDAMIAKVTYQKATGTLYNE